MFFGDPQTPGPRQHATGRFCHGVRRKLGLTGHLMVQAEGVNPHHAPVQAAAVLWSAWGDLHRHRRQAAAGLQPWPLGRRVDDDRVRLSSANEEEKTRAAGMHRDTGRPLRPKKKLVPYGGVHQGPN